MQVYVVFNSEHKTQQVTDSFRQLQNIVVDHALEELVFEVVVDDSEVADVHVDTLPCHSNATVETYNTVEHKVHATFNRR